VTLVASGGSLMARISVVVFHGDGRISDRGARALAQSLAGAGIATVYLGEQASARRVARAAVEERADCVAVCVAGCGVRFLLDLLRELNRTAGRGVRIAVHRVR
jgi:methylmalonyl-CoA mutase cobalamin-binding subunit